MNKPIALVIGASGGIGAAVVQSLLQLDRYRVVAISRDATKQYATSSNDVLEAINTDYSESSMQQIVEHLGSSIALVSRIVIATGVLHDELLSPEKRWEDLDEAQLQRYFSINTSMPIMWLKHLCVAMQKEQQCAISVLSARIGSIDDNRLGGWYGYRASKAALNMLLKTFAIEASRRKKGLSFLAVHPGTTDTKLSAPFQAGVAKEKLFAPDYVANSIVELMENASTDPNIRFVDWQGIDITW